MKVESFTETNEIDEKVYYSLIDGVHDNLKILYKYFSLKKKLLKLEELHIYDTYTDIFTSESKKYTFEELTSVLP